MPSNFDALISKVENYEPLTQEHPKVIAIAKVAVEALRHIASDTPDVNDEWRCGTAGSSLGRIEAIARGEENNA